jgi:hypothetical protein
MSACCWQVRRSSSLWAVSRRAWLGVPFALEVVPLQELIQHVGMRETAPIQTIITIEHPLTCPPPDAEIQNTPTIPPPLTT